jgi:signal transduction histidine kinase
MKKVALVFVLAVLAPSLVLAWLAARSLHDQQFLLERQQSLLDQQVTDALAQNIAGYLADQQRDFSAQVESLASGGEIATLAVQFDDQLRRRWPLAEVGFCVTASGRLLSPPPNTRPSAQMFRLDNSGFLANHEPVEVYLSANNASAPAANASVGTVYAKAEAQAFQLPVQAALPTSYGLASHGRDRGGTQSANANGAQGSRMVYALQAPPAEANRHGKPALRELLAGGAAQADTGPKVHTAVSELAAADVPPAALAAASPSPLAQDNRIAQEKDMTSPSPAQSSFNYKAAQTRTVSPQSQAYLVQDLVPAEPATEEGNLSKVVPAEAEFRQLVGDQSDGLLARFLQNQLKLMCWHRLNANPDLIFGAQLSLDRVEEGLRGLLAPAQFHGGDLCLAVLDDNARPVLLTRENFQANWKRPFVATEVGEALPHWEVAAYLVNPAQLTQAARTARLTLGLLVAVLVTAIGIGSLLIVQSLNAELRLARQKTDFVSNVSHELKTPLTSIRMFSELLAEGRVADPEKQHSYLQIITAETARLTRLINNVLDFSRLERGEKKYQFQTCDLAGLVVAAAETYRPQLETAGFRLVCGVPPVRVPVRADADALSQVLVNLLSNAEKYCAPAASAKSEPAAAAGPVDAAEINLQLTLKTLPLPHAEIRVLDRGPGVPRGCEEKIFEKFYRVHDSLSSGIQGSGLGLTIARQIARAHGGDIGYEPRAGGGSCFSLRLPVMGPDTAEKIEG